MLFLEANLTASSPSLLDILAHLHTLVLQSYLEELDRAVLTDNSAMQLSVGSFFSQPKITDLAEKSFLLVQPWFCQHNGSLGYELFYSAMLYSHAKRLICMETKPTWDGQVVF